VVKLLIYIKHHLKPLWGLIEAVNEGLFRLCFAARLKESLKRALDKSETGLFTVRVLQKRDIPLLCNFLHEMEDQQFSFFNPHDFSIRSLERHRRKRSFLMLGVFDQEWLIGYFFLRFFMTKKCFVGRIVDSRYQRKGVGRIMNGIMYQTAWGMDFRCLATISKSNAAVMHAHKRNPHMKLLKALRNDYLLVEFINQRDAP
jgi:hypothetical protein